MAGIQPLIQPLDVWRGGGWIDDGSLGLMVSRFTFVSICASGRCLSAGVVNSMADIFNLSSV